MSGYRWVTHAGHDWQVLDVELEPDRVMLGLVLDYGRIDEGPSEIGTLALAAGALRAELQRPIEVGPGEVSVPDVDVTVGPTSLTIILRGRRRAVLAAWEHLGALLAEPRLTGTPEPAPTAPRRWGGDLATYTGINAETLSATRLRGTRDLRAAERLLAHLAPQACQVRHVFFTDDPYLVGAGWSGRRVYGTAPTRPARYLDRRPALVRCGDDQVLLAVTAPPTIDGVAAFHALALRLSEILDEAGIQRAVGFSTTYIRDVVNVTYVVDAEVDGRQRRRILDQVLQPGLPLPDTVVDDAIDRVAPEGVTVLQRLRRLWGKDDGAAPLPATPALGGGQAGPSTSVHPATDPLTTPVGGPAAPEASAADDLDAELAVLLAGNGLEVLGVAAGATGSEPDVGGRAGAAPSDHEWLDPRPTAAGTRRCVEEMLGTVHAVMEEETEDLAVSGRFVAWRVPRSPQDLVEVMDGFHPADPWSFHLPHRVCAGGGVLVCEWLHWRQDSKGWVSIGVGTRYWIDLTRLSLAMREDDVVFLFDDRARQVSLSWSSVVSLPRLREALESHGLATIPWYHMGE